MNNSGANAIASQGADRAASSFSPSGRYLPDPFRGHRFAAFALIGANKAIAKATKYAWTANNKHEAQVAHVEIPLENIDSEVFADDSVINNIFEVEIWAGYLEDVKDYEKQIADLKEKIVNHQDQTYFSRRFSGYISQPEWEFGSRGKYLHLDCLDWTGLLRDYKLIDNFEDSQCEVRNIVAFVAKAVVGLTIKVDDYSGSARLGELDGKDKHQIYHSMGKTYWEVLKECADKLGYMVIIDHKTITLTATKKSPFIWNMYYGPKQFQKQNGHAIGQFCDDVKIRYGQKYKTGKSNVVVEVLGQKIKKRGEHHERILFPEDKAITSITNFVIIKVPGSATKEQLKLIAETKYRELAKREVTGTLALPFANNFLGVNDIVEFVIHESEKEVAFLDGHSFVINSISEEMDSNGYKQSVEFESDPAILGITSRRLAPVYKRQNGPPNPNYKAK